jgi:3-deoxy-D-manno-octulosonic-acid transferase
VRFLPYDTPGSVRRFLRRIRPRLAIIMETELWPNLFFQCERMGVPLVLANARLSAKSVSRYRRFGSLFRGVLSATTLVAAQTAEDALRFVAIGAQPDRTHVVGNVKFDHDTGRRRARCGPGNLRALLGRSADLDCRQHP